MQEQNLGKLNIIVAVYGLKTVTDKVSNLVLNGTPQSLKFTVDNRTIGEDGWLGQRKSLMIVYNYDGGNIHVAAAKEGDVITINPDKLKISNSVAADASLAGNTLSVLAASYGPEDVTRKVRSLISSNNILSFRAENTIFGDTWNGVAKTLVIVLGDGNEVSSIEVFTERELCYIDLNELIPAL